MDTNTTSTTQSAVLITGASSGIGAIYADRFARRGHPLVLVARDIDKLNALAARLRDAAHVAVETVQADLTNAADLARIEARVRDDASIGVLVNNAGVAMLGPVTGQAVDQIEQMITLNVTALTRLAHAAAGRFAAAGAGSIVNIGSVVGLAPELGMTVYGATKAFVQYLSQGLSRELTPQGVYVQAVLPAATRTEIWGRAGVDVNTLSAVMEGDELVDAALVGYDRREAVTIPPLPELAQWEQYDAARAAMVPNFSQKHAAERHRAANAPV